MFEQLGVAAFEAYDGLPGAGGAASLGPITVHLARQTAAQFDHHHRETQGSRVGLRQF